VHGSARASASWATWALAACFIVVVDAAVTQTRVLWGETRFEHTRDITRVAFAQTYQAARAIYAPPAPAPVTLLGNSRIWLGAPAPLVAPALAARRAGAPPAANLGIFGAGLGDVETLARHLPHLEPSLVVLTLGTSDLLGTPSTPLAGVPARLLRIGWSAAPLEDAGATGRFDRWLRSLWPLWRFREFAREALHDRVFAGMRAGDDAEGAASWVTAREFRFASPRDFFETVYAERGAAIEAAHRRWRDAGTLDTFVAYVDALNPQHLALVRQRVRESTGGDGGRLGVRLLDATLARLAAIGPALVVVMPENPILAEDTAHDYHRAGYSDEATATIEAAARAHGVAVVDARAWLPPEAFLDFDHPMPDLSGFHDRLAAEIVRVLPG
jgi:hypothetical protein